MAENRKQLSITWHEHAQIGDLMEKDRKLLELATDALDKAYAPYSNFKVGAALELANGIFLSGANYENAAYPMCLCAERSAIAAAVSTYPGVAITAMAITVENRAHAITQPAAPCGACRQVLVETELRQGSDIAILLRGQEGPIYQLSNAKSLLPFYFDGSFL